MADMAGKSRLWTALEGLAQQLTGQLQPGDEVWEAPSETAATPAADPSSRPVAESFGRRGAAPCGETLQARKLQVSPEVKGVNGDGRKSLTRDMRSLLGVGKFNECGPYQHLLQREEGSAKLAD